MLKCGKPKESSYRYDFLNNTEKLKCFHSAHVIGFKIKASCPFSALQIVLPYPFGSKPCSHYSECTYILPRARADVGYISQVQLYMC